MAVAGPWPPQIYRYNYHSQIDIGLWYLHRWLANDHSGDSLENMERPALAENADSGIRQDGSKPSIIADYHLAIAEPHMKRRS